MNTIPHHDMVAAVSCPYCAAPTGQWCITTSGGQADGIHRARRDAASAIIRKQAMEARLEDPRVDVRLTSHDMQIRSLLKGLQIMTETNRVLTEKLDLAFEMLDEQRGMLNRMMRARAVQLVLDGLDSDEPTPEDVWEIDTFYLGEDVRPVTADE